MAGKTDKLTIEYVDISRIKPNEYNPKKLSAKSAKELEQSIREFGVVDPLIINRASGREGIIIGGHQRYSIYKKLGYKQVPVVYVDIPDIEKEKELCLRLSKNTGEWDMELLMAFDAEQLSQIGFSEAELKRIFKDKPDNAEYPITAKLYEHYNYVMIWTDNIIDNTYLEDLFELKRHKSYRNNRVDTVRVISFKHFEKCIKKLKEQI